MRRHSILLQFLVMHSVCVLLIVPLFVHLFPAVSSIACSAAESGGECRDIALPQSKCSNDAESYTAMRMQCCPSPSGACCGFGCPTSSNQWTSQQGPLPFVTSLPPTAHTLTLSPAPVDCDTFSLTASWPHMRNVTGYSVAIYRSLRADVVTYYTTSNPMNTDITLPNLCYDLDSTRLNVELWKIVAGNIELVDHSSIKRRDCYTLHGNNLTTQRSHCGPKISDQVDQSEVQITSASAGDGLFNTAISWPTMAGVMSYDLRFSDRRQYTRFTTNTNRIILTGLNRTLRYSVRIQPYMECAGMYLPQDMWDPCDPLTVYVPQPTSETVHIPLSIVLTSTTSSSSKVPSSLHSTLTSSPPSSPSHPSSPSPPSSPSHPSSPSPPSSSSSAHIPVPTTGLVATLAAVLLLLLLALSVCLFCALYHKRHPHKRHLHQPPSSPLTQSPLPSPPPSSLSSDGTLGDYIPYPQFSSPSLSLPPPLDVSPSPLSVCVLYSLDTPGEQQLFLHEQLGGLRSYGISVKTPGTTASRDVTREWLEAVMAEASAVLLVCNQQFSSEWRSDSDCCGGVRIGREAKVLKNSVKPDDLAKYAYVHFEKTVQEFDRLYNDILSQFITRRFSLAEDRDTLVQSIARFVQNMPRFEYSYL